jgi:DNA replication protein DnaC
MDGRINRYNFDETLDLNQPPEILKKLQTYSDDPKGFLLMSGTNGTGKSYASERILSKQTFKEKFYDSDHRLMITQAMLNIKWQSHINKWGDSLYLLKQFYAYRILILDDIGTRVPTDAFMDFLYAIIDHRWNQGGYLSTIITTNLNSKDMRAKFGDAFSSRISSGVIINFKGDDRRINRALS